MNAAFRTMLTVGWMAFLLLSALAAQSQTPSVVKPLPPIARKFIAAVRQAQTLSVEVTQTDHFKPGSKPDVTSTAELSLQKPNKFVLTSKFDGVPVVAASSDGLTLWEWDKNDYTRQPAPESLEGMLVKADRGLLFSRLDAVAANMAFVMFTHPDALAALPNLQDVGEDTIAGVPARKVVAWTSDVPRSAPLTLETATDKATFWFAADTGLLIQAVVSGVFDTYTIRFARYTIDKRLSDAAFAAIPPTGLTWMHTELNWLKTDSPAPDFTLKTLNGESVTLSALKGRVVLLAFCPSWLPQEFTDTAMALILKAQAAPRAKELTVLWIVETDKPGLVAAFVKAHSQVPMTVILDPPPWPQAVEQTLYHVQATPTFYVISREGKITAGFLGCRLDKQEAIQADNCQAAISVLMHGGIPPGVLSGNAHLSDMMDASSLNAALDAAGLTKNTLSKQ